MNQIEERLEKVQQRITRAALACGRDANDIHLLAVSKTKPEKAIQDAYQAGQRAFGENYLQDALAKINNLQALDIEWHFIGRIQSNKTREIAGNFDWAHGLDKLKHARRINDQRPQHLQPINVCIQVNLSGEASKGGVTPDQAVTLAQQINQLPRLRLRGLMTMPDPQSSPQQQRQVFARLQQLLKQMNGNGLLLDTLSMGMSGDMESAIAEGSTLVRIGTDIFGARD